MRLDVLSSACVMALAAAVQVAPASAAEGSTIARAISICTQATRHTLDRVAAGEGASSGPNPYASVYPGEGFPPTAWTWSEAPEVAVFFRKGACNVVVRQQDPHAAETAAVEALFATKNFVELKEPKPKVGREFWGLKPPMVVSVIRTESSLGRELLITFKRINKG